MWRDLGWVAAFQGFVVLCGRWSSQPYLSCAMSILELLAAPVWVRAFDS